MTTFMQAEFEALAMEGRKIITEVKVNSSITNHPDMLTHNELEKVTSVFRSLETGLREASIYPRVCMSLQYSHSTVGADQDLAKAMKMLGLNMTDQDMVDIPNKIMRFTNINIYFIDISKVSFVSYISSGMDIFSSLTFASWCWKD